MLIHKLVTGFAQFCWLASSESSAANTSDTLPYNIEADKKKVTRAMNNRMGARLNLVTKLYPQIE